MFYNLHQHREATCRRQKEAWEETIKTRLKCEKSKGEIPIVIWGLEASPSFFDFNNEASEPLKNRIRAFDLLHDNYLYNKSAKDGNNYGVKLIKKWINDNLPDTTKGRVKKRLKYSYETLITELSKGDFNLSPKSNEVETPESKEVETPESKEVKTPANNAIHLVYDIFPEWHGLPVASNFRQACLNEPYMREKIPDFEIHLKLIESIFRWHSKVCTPGEIHFVWLATQQGKDTTVKPPKPVAHKEFFQCIKAFRKDVKLYYDPDGFFNGEADLVEFHPADLQERL